MCFIKKIGIITYDCPHLKTEQIISIFSQRKILIHKVYALPFVVRKEREVFIKHRPDQFTAASTEDICYKKGIEYIKCISDKDIDDECDVYIICGAGILSHECVNGKKIITCHPGVIPAVRGLDSFKWAIYKNIPLGCTLHYIGDDVDLGDIISVRKTEIYRTDSIETLARRHYENEILMLGFFDLFLKHPEFDFQDIPCLDATRRMPISTEKELYGLFSEYATSFGKK